MYNSQVIDIIYIFVFILANSCIMFSRWQCNHLKDFSLKKEFINTLLTLIRIMWGFDISPKFTRHTIRKSWLAISRVTTLK